MTQPIEKELQQKEKKLYSKDKTQKGRFTEFKIRRSGYYVQYGHQREKGVHRGNIDQDIKNGTYWELVIENTPFGWYLLSEMP